MDSNHRRLRQQIYSLPPLATRESLHKILCFQSSGTEFLGTGWSWRTESNPRPADYKSAALPAELRQHEIKYPMNLNLYRWFPVHNKRLICSTACI